MDNLENYRKIIRELIQEYAKYKPAQGEVETEVIFDATNDHYELLMSGWNGSYRIHGSIIHIDIRQGKVLIQYDGTEGGVAQELVRAGIPQQSIVLAFKPPEVRPYTNFGII